MRVKGNKTKELFPVLLILRFQSAVTKFKKSNVKLLV